MNKAKQRGVAILFAILLVSIVLTVGMTLLNITLRQLILSSIARESQFAFYAADSGRNCARHYDSLLVQAERPFGYFGDVGTPPIFGYQPPGGGAVAINCGDSINVPVTTTVDGTGTLYTFVLRFTGAKTTCAKVSVLKYQNPLGKTKIESHGFNNWRQDAAPCYLPSDRTVERALQMTY